MFRPLNRRGLYAIAGTEGAGMAQKKDSSSLDEFGSRLRKARGVRQAAEQPRTTQTGLGRALQIAVEMVAALAVGGGIGWLLDDWLDTKPWLLLTFLLVGVAAGLRNAFRTARRMEAEFDEAEAKRKLDSRRDDGASKDR